MGYPDRRSGGPDHLSAVRVGFRLHIAFRSPDGRQVSVLGMKRAMWNAPFDPGRPTSPTAFPQNCVYVQWWRPASGSLHATLALLARGQCWAHPDRPSGLPRGPGTKLHCRARLFHPQAPNIRFRMIRLRAWVPRHTGLFGGAVPEPQRFRLPSCCGAQARQLSAHAVPQTPVGHERAGRLFALRDGAPRSRVAARIRTSSVARPLHGALGVRGVRAAIPAHLS